MAVSQRVDDYLSDKIQTTADLANINDLLAKIRDQQRLLREQLSTAKVELSQAENAVTQSTKSLRQRTSKFQLDQADIDRRLRILSQSEVSDDAVKVFESRMQRLRRLDVATGYVEILKDVDTLVSEVRKEIENGLAKPADALAQYSRLRALLSGLRHAQKAADEAAPHLTDQVEKQVGILYAELKQRLEKDLQNTLEKMQWPKKELNLMANIIEAWSNQVGWLLDLQEADIRASLDSSTVSRTSVVLLPLELMVRPLALRFQYHFYGDRPTNRLDKPEYFFSHVLDLVDQFSPFMTQLFQPILDARTHKSDFLDLHYTDAISSFITALLPMVVTKCLSLLPQINNRPQLFSHVMHELMTFDDALRGSWAYTPLGGIFSDWKGLTGDILDKHGYFNTWLEIERSFALQRYQKILNNSDSNQIDYDTVESKKTKPTKGAVRVNDLLESITDRYRALSSFSQKIKFFIDIQLSIFDEYHGYLHGALQAYLVTSHTAGRLMQGNKETQDDAMGIKGLESLVKVFGSAEYLERKMSDWSEDIFFLELWDELEDRARAGRSSTVGQNLTLDEVASKTSASINPSTDGNDHDTDSGALFDEISKTYRTLREHAESEIIRALETQARNALKPYARVSTWATLSVTTTDMSILTPSPSLDTLSSTLSGLLSFLSKTLASSPLRRILKPLCGSIQKDLIDNIVMKHTFSTAGALQLQRDTLAIQDTIDSSTTLPSHSRSASGISTTATIKARHSEAARNMKKIDETLILLTLPIKRSKEDSHARQNEANKNNDDDDDDNDGDDENAWNFDDTDKHTKHEDNENEDKDEDQTRTFNLWDLEKALFASNEDARHALELLNLHELNEIEARNIIRRRVEVGA